MIFNSLLFLSFFLVFTVLYYSVPVKFQTKMLLAGSLVFYAFFSPVALVLLLLIIAAFYSGGILVEKRSGPGRRFIIAGAVFLVVLILAVTRLLPQWWPGSAADLQRITGMQNATLAWLIPVGLSYLVFSGISYLVDIKRGNSFACREPLAFFSFFLYFPKITQGPIERPAKAIGLFSRSYAPDYDLITAGLKLAAWGFFKKLVIADRLGVIVNTVYGAPGDYAGIALLIATLAFAVQIYADFSGYTDIAIGISKILGIDLSPNFNRPYFAMSVREFWSRWHMTLSQWLRDYLFLPFAYWLSRRMKKESYLGVKPEQWIYMAASFLTFTICGLWHGAGWTFLAWGMVFAGFLSAEMFLSSPRKRLYRRLKFNKKSTFYRPFHAVLTFALVTLSWVFFRSVNLGDAFTILGTFPAIPAEIAAAVQTPGVMKSMLSGLGVTTAEMIINAGLIIFLFIAEWYQGDEAFTIRLGKLPGFARWSFYYILLFMILFFGAFNTNQNFIYAQF